MRIYRVAQSVYYLGYWFDSL